MIKYANIFDFPDYRSYLKTWLDGAKAAKVSNLSKLSLIAQVHPTFLSHILAGSKHLSLEQAASLSEHFAHTRLEREYFFTIIQLDRAGTPALRTYWQEKKAQIEREKNKLAERFEKHLELTEGQKVIFYSSWVYLAVWASTAIGDGQTLSEIAERFRLGTFRAEEITSFLTEIGVCYEEGDRFRMGSTHVHIQNESPLVVKHHSNWRMKAIQKMDFRERNELFFSGPMSISRSDFERIREKLNVLIKETVQIATESSAEDLFCLNIDFFQVPG